MPTLQKKPPLRSALGAALSALASRVRGRRLWKSPSHAEIWHSTIYTWASYSPWLADKAFCETYERIRENTLVDRYRLWELYHLALQCREATGDVLEVGVWKGGSGALMASALAGTDKIVYLADTFSGLVKAGANDSSLTGGELATPVGPAARLIGALGLQNVEILEGTFPDDTGHRVRGMLALVHIDVDTYESARDVYFHVLPKMSPGSVIVFDDYGFESTDGVTAFVNEVAFNSGWRFVYNLNGHAILIRT